MPLSSQLLQAHGAGWILKGRDACERKAEAATSPPGSCYPSPFAFTSAMKAAFLPAVLCPREGGGAVGSLQQFFGFPLEEECSHTGSFWRCYIISVHGISGRSWTPSGYQRAVREGTWLGMWKDKLPFAQGVLDGSGCFCAWKWREAASVCVWTEEGRGLASTPMVSEFSLPCKCFAFFYGMQVFPNSSRRTERSFLCSLVGFIFQICKHPYGI